MLLRTDILKKTVVGCPCKDKQRFSNQNRQKKKVTINVGFLQRDTYCSRSQTKANNKTSACLFAFNQRPEIFVFVSKAPSQVGKSASSGASSLLCNSGLDIEINKFQWLNVYRKQNVKVLVFPFLFTK